MMDSPQSSSNSFELLDERIRRWVWEQKWTTLRDVQETATPPILAGSQDVIISAPTSAGKTEAAFLPILTRLLQDDKPSVRALYVSPLKALINDQFERLDQLCERLDVPVHRWHGDVGQGKKANLIKHPSGVLLITPESLEALFMRYGTRTAIVFKHLDYVVIDEVHSFINSERGAQLRSLLRRLEVLIDKRVPRIGLSATLSEPRLAADFLRLGCADSAVIVKASGSGGEIRAQIRGFVVKGLSNGGDERETSADDAIVNHILDATRGSHNLVFCNRKDTVELTIDALSQECLRKGLRDEYCAHHGNLSKEIRESSEARLKSREQPTTCVCTSTLEMGIDIGPMKSVVQVSCPPSVASLRQRVGRSGRRGEPSILRLVTKERMIEPNLSLADRLRLGTVQCIAMLDLMATGWCEPPVDRSLHLSTLIQQVLAAIVQRGGASIPFLYRLLVAEGPFRSVGQDRFVALLRVMKERELLEQLSDGTLQPGRVGERLCEHYSFYAAFSTPEEYRLVSAGRTLGSMPLTVPVKIGDPLLFAGRRWSVESVEEERKTITLSPGSGKRPPTFLGDSVFTDKKVRETMFRLYDSSEVPPYLDPISRHLLDEGRNCFREHKLNSHPIVDKGPESLIFHWSGDVEAATLRLLISSHGIVVDPNLGFLTVETPLDRVIATLQDIASEPPPDGATLARTVQNKGREKFDWVLSEDLACDEFSSRCIDVNAGIELAKRIIERFSADSNAGVVS